MHLCASKSVPHGLSRKESRSPPMKRRVVFLVAFFAIYAALTALLVMAVPKSNSGVIWTIWVACGIAALSVTAIATQMSP